MSEDDFGKWLFALSFIVFGIHGLIKKSYFYDRDFDVLSNKPSVDIDNKYGKLLNIMLILMGLGTLISIKLFFVLAFIFIILRALWSRNL